MGRGIIKEGPGDADWNSGALLETDERFQTDAEWHGGILESIDFKQDNIENLLQSINENLEAMHRHFEENKTPIIIEKNINQPMTTWRFITSWIFSIIIISIIAMALAS